MFKQLLRWKVVLVVLLVVVIVGSIHYTSLNRPRISFLESFWRDVLSPFQTVLIRIQRFFYQRIETIKSWRNLQQRNQELEALVVDLERQVYLSRNYQRENEWLREALDFKSDVLHELLVAEVIGRSPSNWESSVTINKGLAHGVNSGMAVISNVGIVGTVINSSRYTSKVLLAIDPQSATGGLVQSTGNLVLVEGMQEKSGMLAATPLNRDTEVKPGDVIVTSGLSRIYPKNLLIGEVVAVESRQYDMSFVALVEPFVDFTLLEYVLVVLSQE